MPRERSAAGGTKGTSTRGRVRSAASSDTFAGRLIRAVAPKFAARDGMCNCAEPVTDDEAGVVAGSDEDLDWCWRCRRPILLPD